MTIETYPVVKRQRGFILPSPTLIASGAAIMFGIAAMMFFNLYKGALNDFAVFRAQVEATNNAIAAENARRVAEAIASRDANAAGLAAARVELGKRPPVIRVQSDCGARIMQAAPAARQVADAGASERTPSPAAPETTTLSVAEAETAIGRGIDDAITVYWLQDYIEGQRDAYRE
jgi:hypothetical protein